MLFSFRCPSCGGELEVDASLSGEQAECPQCGRPVAIPEERVDVGTTLAEFRLERRLGKGGMGEVFLARQLSVNRQVALKILPPSFAENSQAVERFLHEGQLAARLDHRNLATIHKAGEDGGNYYLAMAYIEGESLDQRLKRDQRLPETEALAVVRDVAEAMAYAWREFQLLHRDIKPANIMLDRHGRVFLMDLGLAKSLGDDRELTLSGAILGTPRYMSPEQARGQRDLLPSSDIYSLGATLYHLVTGNAPFTGNSMLEILDQHRHAPLPPPGERNPNLSKGTCQLIETMMAKQPRDRCASWQALIEAVEAVLARDASAPAAHPKTETRSGTDRRSLADRARQALANQRGKLDDADAERASRPSRVSARAVTAVVGACLVLALVAVVVLRNHGETDKAATPTASASSGAGNTHTSDTPLRDQASTPAPSSPPVPAPLPSRPVEASPQPVPGKAWTIPDGGMEFVWIEPLRTWVGKYEVTNLEYRQQIPPHDSGQYGGHSLGGDRQPAVYVDWSEVCAYAAWLTAREQVARRLPKDLLYRLPTEEEYLVYAQCGDAREYPWGDGWPPRNGQAGNYAGKGEVPNAAEDRQIPSYLDGHPVTCNVEQSWPNPWGLFGVGGNVWEACAAAGSVDEQQFGAWRGGAWGAATADALRCTSRVVWKGTGEARNAFFGFRLVLARSMPPAPVQGLSWTVPGAGMEFVWIERLGIWVGKYEVTNQDYRQKDPNHDSRQCDGHSLGGDRQPVVYVNWPEACAYAKWLTDRERRAGRLPAGLRYRLPTEDEFLACMQCGDAREFPWGDEWPPRPGHAGNYGGAGELPGKRSGRAIASYHDGHRVTCDVEQSWRNPWGLYGVGGNVWEACAAAGSVEEQQFGAWRGGAWDGTTSRALSCACRVARSAGGRDAYFGFRLILAR